MKTIQPQDCGARGDGNSDDREAFQRALDSAPVIITVPAGRYKIGGTLRIRSGTTLKIHPAATLVLADGAATTCDDYLLTNANPEGGDRDITIEGGVWDGNSEGNPRPSGLFDQGYSGAILHFRNLSHCRLFDAHLTNAEAYYARWTLTRDFHIERIRFSSQKVRRNNDGIHLGGFCENGVIRDIKGLHPGVTGDDLVALNADDAPNRCEVRGMLCGPIRNIRIEDIEATGCHTFVRLLSVWSEIADIHVSGVRGTCEVAALNCDAARGCRVPLFDAKQPPHPDGVGRLRNITIDDMTVAKAVANDIALLRLETRMENFTVTRFRRDRQRDQAPDRPTVRIQHTAVPSLTLDLDHTRQPVAVNEVFQSHRDEIGRLAIRSA